MYPSLEYTYLPNAFFFPLGRPRRRWKDNIRMDVTDIWLGKCGLDLSGSG